jgi:hypothetical protein
MKPVPSPFISLFNEYLVLFFSQEYNRKCMKLITDIRPVHSSRMRGSPPPLSHMISWRGVSSGTEKNLHFKQFFFLAKTLEDN